MKYVYRFYETPDLIAEEIESDEPLPHLRVGHELIRPVRETLAFDALGNERRTCSILDLAGVPREIPFREIARQMRFADGVVACRTRPGFIRLNRHSAVLVWASPRTYSSAP
jgi:hypothetical protein